MGDVLAMLDSKLSSFLSRGRRDHQGRWSRLVADAKRLSADLHLSFAYISIGPTDWLFESLPRLVISKPPKRCLFAVALPGKKKKLPKAEASSQWLILTH